MTTAIIGIGLPGSGKTTVLKQLATDIGAVYVSTDEIRKELTGSEADQSRNPEAWALAYQRIHEALGAGKDVVVDATNAKQRDRLNLIRHCRMKADKIVGVWFTTPDEVCFERNRQRSRVVDQPGMERMAKALKGNPPSEEEGFDELMSVDTSR